MFSSPLSPSTHVPSTPSVTFWGLLLQFSSTGPQFSLVLEPTPDGDSIGLGRVDLIIFDACLPSRGTSSKLEWALVYIFKKINWFGYNRPSKCELARPIPTKQTLIFVFLFGFWTFIGNVNGNECVRCSSFAWSCNVFEHVGFIGL